MTEAAKEIKRTSLELGGNSPAIVFDKTNIERTVEWVMFGCFWIYGQICSATSRLLVKKDIADEFLKQLVTATRSLCLEIHCTTLAQGILPSGGKRYFVPPTIISNVKRARAVGNDVQDEERGGDVGK
ncbi:hypothetical protein PI124_g6507 [Phytophthora idaei]|nr:hypothetical protein PI125_g6198 [Phytophthora idaei]KAG3162472.1 hypothetical protein PI126_g5974 [Phytophthora idaei]KAG3248824.1 hypothetical protein PI124_g6507 [Phytophthora idaei]